MRTLWMNVYAMRVCNISEQCDHPAGTVETDLVESHFDESVIVLRSR